MTAYVGRFAPSPTGPLHAGSLVAALASWLDARAHGGAWLVRIEDVDLPRTAPGAQRTILRQLAQCGLHSDAPVLVQSQRGAAYQQALDALQRCARAYWCRCSRKDIEAAISRQGCRPARHAELVYPGTCREAGLEPGAAALSCRFLTVDARPPGAAGLGAAAPDAARPAATAPHLLQWSDRWLGAQSQDVEHEVGDFVLQRADGCFAYQLAVVVDDAHQGVSHVVRGADLADNTARQILLQLALGLPTPQYLHTPLVLGANGEKLSKQNGAVPLDCSDALGVLQQAGSVLGIDPAADRPAQWLSAATAQWARKLTIRAA